MSDIISPFPRTHTYQGYVVPPFVPLEFYEGWKDGSQFKLSNNLYTKRAPMWKRILWRMGRIAYGLF